jgi:E3 ubiquitin-protein ligase TRIP12
VRIVLQALTSSDVSVFEMITSGAVNCLTQFLQGKELQGDTQLDEQLLRRLRNFAAAALAPQDRRSATTAPAADIPDGLASTALAGGAAAAAVAAASHVPLAALVRKLQAALSSAEAFPVLCSRIAPAGPGGGSSAVGGRSFSRSAGMSGSFTSSSLTSGLAALTQPFKLRLIRHAEVGMENVLPIP